MTMLRHTHAEYPAKPAQTTMAGLLTGTVVLTACGEKAVEELHVGDRVITCDKGLVTLRAVSRRRAAALTAISIRADSLGMARPAVDVAVAPAQNIYLRDWRAEALFGAQAALVPAARLCDGEYVREVTLQDVGIFELHFEHDHVLYANGLEVGSGCSVDALVRRAT